jgi:hypothetical protein
MLSTGTFLDKQKLSEIKPMHKKVTQSSSSITGQFHFLLHFQKSLKDYITI